MRKVVAWQETDGLLDWVEFEHENGQVVRLILYEGDSKRRWPAWMLAEWLEDDDIPYAGYTRQRLAEARIVEGSIEELGTGAPLLLGMGHSGVGDGQTLREDS